ncbi:MAG: DegV family protein [Syntrophomonadaceae bacterium]
MSIRIVADSCCDLPPEIIKSNNIRIVNMEVRFGDRVYQSGEISNAEFYELMDSSPVLPSTTQPTLEELTRVYSEALSDGSQVLAIHFSSGISGTFQGGQLAQKMLGDKRLTVFDSQKASVGCGLMVLEAARMAQQGLDLQAILQRLEEMRDHLQCLFTVSKMEYLIRGGRISRSKGTLAHVLDIKPILYFDSDGYIMPLDKARGHKGAMRKLLAIMENQGQDLALQTVGLSHAASPEAADYLRDAIQTRFRPRELIIGEIGPVIGAHVGPGTCAIFFES